MGGGGSFLWAPPPPPPPPPLLSPPPPPPHLSQPLPRLAEMKTRGRTSYFLVERHAKASWQTGAAFVVVVVVLLIFSASPVLSSCSPAWQRNCHTLIELPPKKHGGPFSPARSTLWNPLDSKGPLNIQLLMQGCKFEQSQSWPERVFPLSMHITARSDLVPTYIRILPAFIRRRWFWRKFQATFWHVLMMIVVWLLDV